MQQFQESDDEEIGDILFHLWAYIEQFRRDRNERPFDGRSFFALF